VPIAERIRDRIKDTTGVEVPVGAVDISFYRDDVGLRTGTEDRIADHPVVGETVFDAPVEGATIVLVDDVLYTGRTVRAAIDAVFDYGRPACVQLAVLADRGHRELPFRADFVGKNLPTQGGEHVRVRLMETDGVDEVVLIGGEGDEA
jgi:pyrimidine operon attenuation protein/uracil phosphoribosyltransferase